MNARRRRALRTLVLDLCVLAGALVGLSVGLHQPTQTVACREDIRHCVSDNMSAGLSPVLVHAGIGAAIGIFVALGLIATIPGLRPNR
jgi:hypothetical protein